MNDYLARRDMEWMGPLFTGLGLTVGAIQSGMDSGERQKVYACDITYGTNNEFGFDYLRDNMRIAARGDDRYPKHHQQAQGHLHFAIVDEVDNILIDEARTPLIISGPAEDDITKYQRADKVARQLKKDAHFEVKEKEHTANLTDEGVREAEQLAGVESFYTAGNMQWPHLIDNSLKAHHLYKRDVNYVVQDGEVVIVDEFTGRLMPGRHWSDGLHQAVEAKEGVTIKEENQTLATITLQNFFKLYDKIAGMTGTALTEAGEFWKIYELDVIGVPTNRPLQAGRVSGRHLPHRAGKVRRHRRRDRADQPLDDASRLTDGNAYIGTIRREDDQSVEAPAAGEQADGADPAQQDQAHPAAGPAGAGRHGVDRKERAARAAVGEARHQARGAQRQASQARGGDRRPGRPQRRGHHRHEHGRPRHRHRPRRQCRDDGLGPACRTNTPRGSTCPRTNGTSLVAEIEQREGMKPEGQQVKQLGGLHIIGTERHEARRIDLQLRGRCGRQGDPGSSRFYLSLEDDLMRIFAGEWVKNMLTRLGMQEGEAIESRWSPAASRAPRRRSKSATSRSARTCSNTTK